MFEACLVVVLAAHLMCMNIGGAGPLVCLWLEWREGRGDEWAGRAGRYLASLSLNLLLFGSALGLLLGWLLWSPLFRDVLSLLSHRVKWGVPELGVSLVLMVLHLFWWTRARQSSFGQRAVRMFLLLAAGTNLMYHFPFLFVIISNKVAEGHAVSGQIESAEFVRLMLSRGVLARTTHFLLASFAVAGIALVAYCLRQSRHDADNIVDSQAAIWGARLALFSTFLQMPVGMWLLLELPEPSKQLLMGGSVLGTGLLCLSILTALLLMHQLAAMSMGTVSTSSMRALMITMVVIVLLMSGTLRSSLPGGTEKTSVRQQNLETEYVD